MHDGVAKSVFFLQKLPVSLIFLFVISIATLGFHAPALDASRATTAERRVQIEIDVLLRLHTHQERRNVDELLSYANVTLLDEHPCVMDGFRQAQLEHERLQTSFQEILRLQGQNIIQIVLIVGQEPVTVHATKQCIPFEYATRIVLVQGQQRPGGISDFGQSELDAPKLALVAKAVLSNQLQFLIQTFLLERPARLQGCLAIYRKGSSSVDRCKKRSKDRRIPVRARRSIEKSVEEPSQRLFPRFFLFLSSRSLDLLRSNHQTSFPSQSKVPRFQTLAPNGGGSNREPNENADR